jgi:hypothetical protein
MQLSRTQGRPTRTTVKRHATALVTMVSMACGSSAWAQKVTTVEELTLQQVLVQLSNPLAIRPVGEAIGATTAVEIGTSPFGTSSGGFVFKLDPATGLLARTTTTFGPSFTERAITSGEGQISVGATFSATTYDKLGDFALARLPLGSVTGTTAATRTLTGDFNLSSKTLALAGTVGVTENFDVAVVVPMVSVKLRATSALVNGQGVVTRLAETDGVYSGIGDIAAIAKYRFFKFKGPELPDPGGIAILVNARMPTGDRDNLRGLDVTRTLVSAVTSFGTGKLRPHANVGFEYWSKSVDVPSSFTGGQVKIRHQIQYAAGVELEATPKLTLNVDFIGQHIRGGGQVGAVTDTPTGLTGVSSLQSLVALEDGIRKALIVPGLKVNLKGKMLLSLNAIITATNNGLHARVTPVVGVNLTM